MLKGYVVSAGTKWVLDNHTREQGPKVTEKKRCILVNDLISSNFVSENEKKQGE